MPLLGLIFLSAVAAALRQDQSSDEHTPYTRLEDEPTNALSAEQRRQMQQGMAHMDAAIAKMEKAEASKKFTVGDNEYAFEGDMHLRDLLADGQKVPYVDRDAADWKPSQNAKTCTAAYKSKTLDAMEFAGLLVGCMDYIIGYHAALPGVSSAPFVTKADWTGVSILNDLLDTMYMIKRLVNASEMDFYNVCKMTEKGVRYRDEDALKAGCSIAVRKAARVAKGFAKDRLGGAKGKTLEKTQMTEGVNQLLQAMDELDHRRMAQEVMPQGVTIKPEAPIVMAADI